MIKKCIDKIIALAAAAALALSVLPIYAFAVEDGEPVVVGVNPDYGISSVGGTNSGLAFDYLREMQKRTSRNYTFVSGTAPELAEKLASGEVDIVPCVSEWELSAWKEMSGKDALELSGHSLVIKYSAIYVRDDSDIDYYDVNALKESRIGYLTEDSSKYFPGGAFIATELRGADFVEYATETQMRSDLESGKLDAVVKDCFRTWPDELIVYQLATEDCYFLASAENASMLNELDQAVGSVVMIDSSFSSDLYKKYISKYGSPRYALSESEKHYIEKNPVLNIAYNMESSMTERVDSSTGQLMGGNSSAMQELSEVSGLEIKLFPYDTLSECLDAMSEGKVQAICGGVNAYSLAGHTELTITAPYSRIPIAAAGKPDSTVGSRSRIAIPAGCDDITAYITDVYPGAQILHYESERQCFNAVDKGEADVVFGGIYEMMTILRENYTSLAIIDVRTSFHSECLAINKKDGDLAYIIGKSLACLNSIRPQIRNYLSVDAANNAAASANQFLEQYLVWIIVGILLILAALFVIICISAFRTHRVNDIDQLTGGRSKRRFFDDAKKILKKTSAEDWAVVLFDIDKFKYVNDRLGYEEGNRMLERLHKTVSDHIERDEVFARLSDDNFAMMIKNASDNELNSRISNIFAEFDRRNALFVKYPVIFSAGVCRMNQCVSESKHGEIDVNTALDRCKIAKSTLKGTHYSSIAFYDGKIRDRALREKDYENIMPAALKNREFQCYLQPKYGLRTRSIEGAEALIRWNSPDFGFISPGDFIPISEKNGFVVELDFFILEEVCRTMRRWIDQGKKPVVVSVNQSRLHLNYDDYIWRLREIVDKYDIPYEYIELELTESVFTENAEKLLKIMHKLHEIGFKLSLDDFGSGYSSLNMLKDMPVDVVKIDKEFFSDTMNTSKGRAVITTVVDLAKNLDMDVISEGVETREQVEFLTEIHCAMVQGYYFAKPMPIPDFEKLWFDDLEKARQKREQAAAQQQKRLDAAEHNMHSDKPEHSAEPASAEQANVSAETAPAAPQQEASVTDEVQQSADDTQGGNAADESTVSADQ